MQSRSRREWARTSTPRGVPSPRSPRSGEGEGFGESAAPGERFPPGYPEGVRTSGPIPARIPHARWNVIPRRPGRSRGRVPFRRPGTLSPPQSTTLHGECNACSLLRYVYGPGLGGSRTTRRQCSVMVSPTPHAAERSTQALRPEARPCDLTPGPEVGTVQTGRSEGADPRPRHRGALQA